ncbi:RHS repeat domain-containing protein, partial [Leucothrix arctica]
YEYDNIGNRTQGVVNGITTAYTYDDNDRLTQQGGEHYRYDDNGSTLEMTIDDTVTAYQYNALNQLIEVQTREAGVVTDTLRYTYDINGIRTRSQENGTDTRFVIDNNQAYAQVVQEQDATGQIQVNYLYGDDLLQQQRDTDISYYHYDGLGSTRLLTDSTGLLTDRYRYDAFGEDLETLGNTVNRYRFTGEQYDANLAFYYLRARYYNPHQGRFTQQDTWMGNNSDPITLHKYLYANANPVNMVDPTGNFSMGSAMSSINTMGTLASIATTSYDVAGMFAESGNGESLPSAGDIGGAVLFGLVGKQVFKPLSKLCQKNKKAKRYCNFVIGYVGAELKIDILAGSKSSNWLNKKRKNTIVGAFDLTNGLSVAEFNRGKGNNPTTHASLGGTPSLGCLDSGTGITVGNCAEFMAANKLLRGGAKRKAIRWTFAYHVDKSGKYGSRGFIKSYCGVCVRMFNVKN